MNPGAFVFEPNILTPAEIEEAAALTRALGRDRSPVHEIGRYSDLRWFQAPIDPELPICRKIFRALGITEAPSLLVFYYLEPGAKIHPHRDLTGAALNNRIRFHVPIVTNPGIDFRVKGERLQMKPGDLWCLDTSYKHSVENAGSEDRVHLIIECDVNDHIRRRLPKGLGATVHNVSFFSLMAAKFAQAVVWNSFRRPGYFKQQMKIIWSFLLWRVLKVRRL